ncbi:MAG: 23S rRNA (uracil(1939)-C(5))-methyltransferase RlmD [Christensenellaceae bacterium]
MDKNDILECNIEDINTDGHGVGRCSGHVIFVPGALPGEHVRVKIILVKKKYSVGRLLDILTPSPQRQSPPCRYFTKCGGCTLQHLSYAGQLAFKHAHVESCLQRIAKQTGTSVAFPLPARAQYRYRNKAAFPVQSSNTGVNVGLYAPRSHDVVDIDDCLLQSEVVKIVMSQLRVWIVKYAISVYDEKTGKGLLRHIVIRENSAGEIMVIFSINGEDIPHQRELLTLVRFVLPQIKSIILSINQQNTNVILGDRYRAIYGRDYLYETIDGLDFRFGPHSFLQVNTAQSEALYRNLVKEMAFSSDETLLDLFCGVGTIALLCARHVKRVYGVEIVEQAAENARFNAKMNAIENAEFFCGNVDKVIDQAIQTAAPIHSVIVDPPRKGLAEQLIHTIAAQISPKKIGYVSCDPATFARDLAIFTELGYTARAVQPIDMFPQTTHVECLTVLTKANG